MTLDKIVQWIILIGAAIGAIKAIYGVFAKPTSYFKKRATEGHKRIMKETLEEELPIWLTEMGKPYIEYITKHEKALDTMQECTETTRLALQNIIRQKVLETYYMRKATRTLYQYEKESIDQLYEDYKKFGGNSYVEELYRRMSSWDVMPEGVLPPENE